MERKDLVLISCSSVDDEIALTICKVLEFSKIPCKISSREVSEGKADAKKIADIIHQVELVLFISSKDSNGSSRVKEEIRTAFKAEKIIIPFKIDGSEYADELKDCLDLSDEVNGDPFNWERVDELVDSVKDNLSAMDDEEDDANAQYEFLYNGKTNQVLMLMSYRFSAPLKPRFVYDGGDSMILYRNPYSVLTLRNLDENARPILNKAEEIMIVEILDEDYQREYHAPVRRVTDLKPLL